MRVPLLWHESSIIVNWGVAVLKSALARVLRGELQMRSPVRLPMSLANFDRRGFRLDRPVARGVLERHACSFLHGFNLAAERWAAPHEELHDQVPEAERGFAYEGAGMYAALLDLVTAGRAHALRRLLDGPGDRYTHLIHVGAGWLFTPLRVTAVPRLPEEPLLRWLALDGAGFGEVYFGGLRALGRRAAARPGPHWQTRVAGCGRALWFVESADPDGIADVIDRAAAPARSHLWAGVGLAVTYAGGADDDALDRLAAHAEPHYDHFGQGVVFGATARHRSGTVPAHTARAAARFLGAPVDSAAHWSETTAADLRATTDVHAYLRWTDRLRGLVAARR
jgi:enediyne biosynthesis protein E3